MKHTQIPHQLTQEKLQHNLQPGDKMVYGAIRRYMAEDTRECYPSITNICNKLKCSRAKVDAAIDRLVETGLLIRKHEQRNGKDLYGVKNHYYFPKSEFDKKFEMFTDEFFDLDLPLNVKEYYMDIQEYLYGKETGVGRCSFSNAELARRTGWTTPSIKKYNTVLIEKGLLEEETTNERNEAGLPIITKNFNLTGLNQAALWVKAVTAQITQNTTDIEDMKRELEELKAWKQRKEKEEALQRNRVIETPEFNF